MCVTANTQAVCVCVCFSKWRLSCECRVLRVLVLHRAFLLYPALGLEHKQLCVCVVRVWICWLGVLSCCLKYLATANNAVHNVS
jgi:hypothetical protein